MKKLGMICLTSILVLGGLGVGYAAWTDEIYVGGTVQTGELSWQFTGCNLLDDSEPVNPGGDYPTTDPDYTSLPGFIYNPEVNDFFWKLDKNVAWGECGSVDLDQDGDNETLQVTFHNVYPCNFNELSFYPMNTGTIPLKIDHLVINGQWITTDSKVEFDFNQDGQTDFELWWNEQSFGQQIEPNDRGTEHSIWFHTLQPCPQNSIFTFTITIVAVQWNEYPLPAPTVD
ncbi:MAG: hypothetical protein P3T54_07890 [Dehalogenimonas sp.]|uniref:SipW-cognate class signal peptide n=1 Tax=Candidatus Dehalogenimonas loeffleri TaxID=3127115 RepID=A0ABZ2JB03_9CHLR|nr:hypothetical protein [Dehalogenimonas sp.]